MLAIRTLPVLVILLVGFDGYLVGQPKQPQRIWQEANVQSHRVGNIVVRELTTSSRPGLVLVWAELQGSINVAEVRLYGQSNDIYARSVPNSAVGAVNGGIFGYTKTGKYLPLGLIIENSRRKNPQAPWNTGGAVIRDRENRTQVLPVRQIRSLPPPVAALQSKPLLVENGAVAINSNRGDARYNRSAVAVTSSGAIVLVGAFESFGRALDLKEFAEFLVALRSIDKIQIETALAMDGGPGAHLFFPPLGRHYGDPGVNFVPNLIYVGP
jgi:uncharacterized protein YigE (DUF2233 family)